MKFRKILCNFVTTLLNFVYFYFFLIKMMCKKILNEEKIKNSLIQLIQILEKGKPFTTTSNKEKGKGTKKKTSYRGIFAFFGYDTGFNG